MTNREHFRLRIPPQATLQLSTDNFNYEVCELSEQGLRIIATENDGLQEGTVIRGKLNLHDNSEAQISGTVARKDGDEWIITGLIGLSMPAMLSEQRYIINWFPPIAHDTTPDTPSSPSV